MNDEWSGVEVPTVTNLIIEMPFSETRDYPYAYVNRKRTINAIHIFNMDDISVNPNRE